MGQGWRRSPLPRDWPKIRRVVLRRDRGICSVCGRPGADQVHHVNEDPDDHRLSNLAAIHEVPCHRKVTALQANAARPKRGRPLTDQHPGLL